MDKQVINVLESFLHDVREGESDISEITNALGYNEFKQLLELAKKADHDPIPLPTIKPGDRVNHKKHKNFKNGLVVTISKSGKRAYVSWTGYGAVTYPLTSLEVISHD